MLRRLIQQKKKRNNNNKKNNKNNNQNNKHKNQNNKNKQIRRRKQIRTMIPARGPQTVYLCYHYMISTCVVNYYYISTGPQKSKERSN